MGKALQKFKFERDIIMATAETISEELIRSAAPDSATITNALKISKTNGFISLNQSGDGTLIFGECKGSGSKPYSTSVDFSGDSPIFRCSCPSRKIPCKHCIAIMEDWLAGKKFAKADIPEDVARKREKIAKKEANKDEPAKPKKQNKNAAAKKLQKQSEGLDLAEQFVNDLLNKGVSSVSRASAGQYKTLAKQLGDYYLPEPQAIMDEIISAAEELSETPDDKEINRLVALCVKLSSTVKKSRAYIKEKLESGEVLPEDNILYEAMGGVWKLTQLKEIGLYKENARILQLSFTVIADDMHKALIDTAYWIDADSGEISKTENIRPLKALKHIKAEDSCFGLCNIKELYRYPGGLNRRIRWESADIVQAPEGIYKEILEKAEKSVSDAVKKAKNELKNTLSDTSAALLVPYETIGFAEDGHGVLKFKDETISLKPNTYYPNTLSVLKLCAGNCKGGAVLGEMFYEPELHRISLCPISIVDPDGITRLC